MKTRALYIAATLTIGLLFACSLSLAQDTAEPQHSFGCSSTQAESTFSADLNHPSKLQLVPVTDTREIQQAETDAFHTIYSKIDSAKYKISKVDFYVHQEKPEDPEQAPPYSPLTIYVKLTSPDQALWWKVIELPREGLDESFRSAQLPRVGEEGPAVPATILPATGDRTIPIFDLRWNSSGGGVWTNDIEAHLLIDLRLPQPKVAADLSCNSVTAYGVCGVWDAQQSRRNNYECDWIAANNDFRCEGTEWDDESKRQRKSWFELLSGKDIAFSVPAGNPATLQKFAELAEADTAWRGRQVELPGLGQTSHLLRLPVAHNNVVHILGTYGRFFYVILSKKDPPELGYIPTVALFEDDPEDQARHLEVTFQNSVSEKQALPTPASEIKLGGVLSFGVKPLYATPLTHIYQVTAREDASRAVYWLAIDDQQADGRTLFSMPKLAGNGSKYVGCARYRSEASAAGITRLKGRNFRALIDVEPSHISSEAREGIEPPDTCPYSIHLEWNHTEWVTDDPRNDCGETFTPRTITIADDGTITAKPGQVDNGESR